MLGRWDTMRGWGGDGGLWMLAGILVIAVAVLIGINVPAFDERDEVKVGWFASRLNGLAQARADDRFGLEQRGSAVEPGLEQQ